MTKFATTTLKNSFKMGLVLSAMFTIGSAQAQIVNNNALPTGGTVVAGQIDSINTNSNQMTITQSSDRAVINWQSFNIGKSANVNIVQPNTSSWTVNRVTGTNTSPTQILGKLTANGNVAVLDRNGVLIGPYAQIDIGGLVASTGNIDDQDFMNGDNTFSFSNGSGNTNKYVSVSNRGTITTRDGGLVALVGPNVTNSGRIIAKLGKVTLASAETYTVDLYGDQLIELDTGVSTRKSEIKNQGLILADGGTIELSIAEARNITDNLVNLSTGIVRADTVRRQNGKIILSNTNTPKMNNKRNVIAVSQTAARNVKAASVYISGTLGGPFSNQASTSDITNVTSGDPYAKETAPAQPAQTPQILRTPRTANIQTRQIQANPVSITNLSAESDPLISIEMGETTLASLSTESDTENSDDQ